MNSTNQSIVEATPTLDQNNHDHDEENSVTAPNESSRFSIKITKKPVPSTPRGVLAE